MVILHDTTPTTDSEASTTTEPEEDAPSADPDPGLLTRLSEKARLFADLLEPFTNLLTAIVQAATVAALVRNA